MIDVTPGALTRLQEYVPPGLEVQAQPGFEAVVGTIRHLITAASTAFVIELFALGSDPHDQLRFSRRRRVMLLGRAV